MPIDAVELINAAELVAQQHNMKVTLKYSAAGGAFVGAAATVGSLLLGPIGLLTGAIGGGLSSFLYFKERYKSLVSIIQEDLTPRQKQQLVWHLENAVKDFDVTDLIKIATVVMSNEALFLAIADGLKKFVNDELHASIQ